MDPLKHYGFLFGASGPGKPMNLSNKVMTAPQRETPEDEQMAQTMHKMSALAFKQKRSHPCYVKSSVPTWEQIKHHQQKVKMSYDPLEAPLLQRLFSWP
jgi:hypothetical protein